MDDLPGVCPDEMHAQYFSCPPTRNNFAETVCLTFGDGSVYISLVQREYVNVSILLAGFRFR